MAIMKDDNEQYTFDYEPIRGFPELRWTGKRPFKGTMYFPAQLKETHGDTVDGWRNKIYWGDNLQVMSHMLREYRGKVKLVYIDPPFDSKADYKKTIEVRGRNASSDSTNFEEKQYTDIWTNDEYLQFMYERLILIRELLASDGSLFIHCDWHKSHYLRMICDEVFGGTNFRNEIIWKRKGGSANPNAQFDTATDTILFYAKTNEVLFNQQFDKVSDDVKRYIEERFNNTDEGGRKYMKSPIVSPNYRENLIYDYKGYSAPRNGWSISKDIMEKWDKEGKLYFPNNGDRIYRKIYLDEYVGQPISNLWTDIFVINPVANERLDYPTQKPESLLTRIIKIGTNPGDLVFDCFMGSGTTQAVATKLGRRYLGADINLGAVQTTSKRLLGIADELKGNHTELGFEETKPSKIYSGFEVYTVNHYDFFRNELEARDLLIQALEIQKLPGNMLWDGELDGWKVKILAINRLATAADLNAVLNNLDFKGWEKKTKENPGAPVERIKFVCMGHDPDLRAQFLKEMEKYGFKVDVEIVDILRDKQELQFKRDSEAKIKRTTKKLEVQKFYPMNLLQKLSLEKAKVGDWRELVDSILIDWNYDGAVFTPTLADIPNKKELVKGVYEIPGDAGTIRVKITDLLSESWEGNVEE